jgi:hypothetical protein
MSNYILDSIVCFLDIFKRRAILPFPYLFSFPDIFYEYAVTRHNGLPHKECEFRFDACRDSLASSTVKRVSSNRLEPISTRRED